MPSLCGLAKNTYDALGRYFENRTGTITSKYDAVSKIITKGCPQGSVLGPGLWNIVFDEIVGEEIEGCAQVAYADDLALQVRGNSRLQLEDRAVAALTRIKD